MREGRSLATDTSDGLVRQPCVQQASISLRTAPPSFQTKRQMGQLTPALHLCMTQPVTLVGSSWELGSEAGEGCDKEEPGCFAPQPPSHTPATPLPHPHSFRVEALLWGQAGVDL